MIYVTMTDKFMSGWGQAQGKINKLVIVCETREEAQTVYNNALARTEMKNINICNYRPYYRSDKYFTSYHDKHDYQTWFETNAF